MNFRINNVVQSGLLSKWKKAFRAKEFHQVKIQNKQFDQSDERNLKLNQVLSVFYATLYCLPFSIATLFIEMIVSKICSKMKNNQQKWINKTIE